MRRTYQRRKVAPKVRDGVVQKKHNHVPTTRLGYVVDRESPAKGHRHLVTKRDVHDFTAIIPGWSELCVGLEGIVLTAGGRDHEGRYRMFQREGTAMVEIPAWEGDLWQCLTIEYFDEHRPVFERIGLSFEHVDDGVECRFTAAQAKAFQLLHIFLHELGHHVDRMQTRSQAAGVRGEGYAERYANELLERVWPEYVQHFGDPRRANRA